MLELLRMRKVSILHTHYIFVVLTYSLLIFELTLVFFRCLALTKHSLEKVFAVCGEREAKKKLRCQERCETTPTTILHLFVWRRSFLQSLASSALTRRPSQVPGSSRHSVVVVLLLSR